MNTVLIPPNDPHVGIWNDACATKSQNSKTTKSYERGCDLENQPYVRPVATNHLLNQKMW